MAEMRAMGMTGMAGITGMSGMAGMGLPSLEGIGPIITRTKAPEGHPLDEVISGFEFRTKDTQALELDDFVNPGFLWVEYGQQLWTAVDGSAGKSCASCHGDPESMKNVRATMPRWNANKGKPFPMEAWINECRTERMGAEAWKWESNEMLSATAFVGWKGRGVPVNVDLSAGDMKAWWEKGKELYYTRFGQLNMACANCHEDNFGKYIRADRLSQGQSNGFPTYRLKWQGLGSLHRRFKGCMDQIRAAPFKRGSDEFTALEVYVNWRGTGLSVESPAVRQ
ncbi:MAG: sulfur oxidation c-type cytochrome SoxA [Hyphomicrobiales bacterium]|nr:sulfur oxidation c-type cytochrome SoxA [Hyphomicrobiales bacterium]